MRLRCGTEAKSRRRTAVTDWESRLLGGAIWRAAILAAQYGEPPSWRREQQNWWGEASRRAADGDGTPSLPDLCVRSRRHSGPLRLGRPAPPLACYSAPHSRGPAEQQRRKPLLLLREAGLTPSRDAERQYRAMKCQLPPRNTRPPPEAGPVGSVVALP